MGTGDKDNLATGLQAPPFLYFEHLDMMILISASTSCTLTLPRVLYKPFKPLTALFMAPVTARVTLLTSAPIYLGLTSSETRPEVPAS